MNIQKLKININEILSINPITNKKINRGYKCELAFKAHKTNYIDYKLDNKVNIKFGDYKANNFIYQIKSRKCELKLVKSLGIICDTFEDILANYLKYEKANRYIYILEHDNLTYAITMKTNEFKNFVKLFGTYNKSGNSIRIYKSDNIIWNWIQNN